jgi:hypothetical protein
LGTYVTLDEVVWGQTHWARFTPATEKLESKAPSKHPHRSRAATGFILLCEKAAGLGVLSYLPGSALRIILTELHPLRTTSSLGAVSSAADCSVTRKVGKSRAWGGAVSTTSVCPEPVVVKLPALMYSSPEENHAS